MSLPLTTTIIAVAHRAASLSWMDRILVMDNGTITEDGSPLVLLQKGSSNDKHEQGCDRGSYYRTAVELEGEEVLQQAVQAAQSSTMARPRGGKYA